MKQELQYAIELRLFQLAIKLYSIQCFVKDWLLEDKDLGSEDEDKNWRSEDKDKNLDLRSEDEDKDSNFKCWSTC